MSFGKNVCPFYIKKALRNDYKINHMNLLCQCSISAIHSVPTVRIFFFPRSEQCMLQNIATEVVSRENSTPNIYEFPFVFKLIRLIV